MKARQLIAGAAFAPNELHVIFEGFDAAWTELAAEVGSATAAIETARLSLATIVLSLASTGPIERDGLTRAAVDAFRLKHRLGSRSA